MMLSSVECNDNKGAVLTVQRASELAIVLKLKITREHEFNEAEGWKII